MSTDDERAVTTSGDRARRRLQQRAGQRRRASLAAQERSEIGEARGGVAAFEPGDEIAIVARRRRQRGLTAGCKGGVRREDLLENERERATVEEDVMKRPHELRATAAAREQGDAQERRPP